MERQQDLEQIAAQLDEYLSTREVPPHFRDWGARLIDHLRRPIRIVVTGLPGSGKSSLINMMLERQVIGGSDGVPVLDVTFGPEEQVLFELENGKTVERDGLLVDASPPRGVIRAQQMLPQPSLQGQSYRELGLGQAPEISKRILAAALKDADMVLWCTNSFGENEQLLWSSVPDEIKDHSFLVITRADRQMMWGVLSETLETLDPIVSEEFLGMYPVATLQALSALSAQQEPDAQLWSSSGGKSLCDEIAAQVASGRSADIDQAQMLLTQLTEGKWPTRAGAASVAAKVSSDAAEARANGAGISPSAGAEVGMQPAAGTQLILDSAVKILTASGKELLREIDGEAAVDTDAVLERCAATIGALSSHLHETLSDDPALQQAQDSAREGEEMLMLFQLERGEDAALDAVTLLLQMRKELSIRESA
ncbi:hypothetical protein [Marimonas arenosa]|uniref:Dynamin family protein n=1 Tax=Marimonas arenosa TaxID=1795305 RepID=A0AAE3WFS9_9RHOB|nr:hypothetical protein [Marimonas arenosa]MDQ2090887.1 hypothetical protein [Marimonas arenosa]